MSLIDICEWRRRRLSGGNPSVDALLKVADAFAALHRLGVKFDPDSTWWDLANPSAVPVCHAGAFGLAAGMEMRDDDAAADALALHLGFRKKGDMPPRSAYAKWAGDNPRIWGGGGALLFTDDAAAFGDVAEVDLNIIADHYRRVAVLITPAAAAAAARRRGCDEKTSQAAGRRSAARMMQRLKEDELCRR